MNHIAEPHALAERQAIFSFRLDLDERVSGDQVVRGQLLASIGGKRQIPGAVRKVERTANQLAFAGRMLRPRDHGIPECDVGSRLVTRQSALLDQVKTELAEPISVLVVVEAAARPHMENQA